MHDERLFTRDRAQCADAVQVFSMFDPFLRSNIEKT
jgi:hypothetical protein